MDNTQDNLMPQVDAAGLLSAPQMTPGLLNSLMPEMPQQQVQQPSQNTIEAMRARMNTPAPADTGGLLLAMAGGVGGNTAPGRAFQAAADHFKLQDQLKAGRDKQDLTLQLQQDKLDETKRLNDAKINGLSAKAAKDGMPKVIGKAGGQTTLLWPDNTISSHSDGEVQAIYEQAEAAKTTRASMMANSKAQLDLLTNPKQAEEDNKLQAAYDGAKQAFGDFTDTKKMFEDTGGVSTFSRLGIPGTNWFNRVAGTQDGQMQQQLAKLNLTGFLSYVKGFPGALSDKEGARISKALPQPDADPKIWADFFQKEGPVLEAAMNRAEALMNERKARVGSVMAQPSNLNGGQPQTPVSPVSAGAPDPTTVQQPAPVQPQSTQRVQAYPGKAGALIAKDRPAGFPVIAPAVQKARDNDRAQILTQELTDEAAKPDSPEKAKNIAALQRELKGLGVTAPVATPAAPVAVPAAQHAETITRAKAAIAAGADRAAVIKRLQSAGIPTQGL